MTGGRLKRVKDHVGNETFCFTYGDGLTNVNIADVIALHRKTGALATVTASRHPSRFGILHIEENSKVTHFAEKPVDEAAWMNSGFFVLEPAIFDMIDGDETVLEKEPLHRAVASGKFCAYKHEGFFMGMDSLREKNVLEELWNSGKAPWHVW
jgi:glucose-1-phosphate cytidylyltransferase